MNHNQHAHKFAPTHLITLSELSPSQREKYFDLLINSDAQFHKGSDSEGGNGEVYADIRILGPGVKIGGEGPRLTPQQKLTQKESSLLPLPGLITTTTATLFNYRRYTPLIKLLRPHNNKPFTYKPKRRGLTWCLRLVHEIFDARYVRDTSDIGGDSDDDGMYGEHKKEVDGLTDMFPVFIVDLFSKKYGLKSIVESTTWDLIYSLDCLRNSTSTSISNNVNADVLVFLNFIELTYDSDELLYYCYVRSLTQSVLDVNFKTHCSDTGRTGNSSASASAKEGIDRIAPILYLTKRECTYISQTIFLRGSSGGEDGNDGGGNERLMYEDFTRHVSHNLINNGRNIDSAVFLKVAVERYFESRPRGEDGVVLDNNSGGGGGGYEYGNGDNRYVDDDRGMNHSEGGEYNDNQENEHHPSNSNHNHNHNNNEYQYQYNDQVEEEEEQGEEHEQDQEQEQEQFAFDHPLMTAIFSGASVESSESLYITSIMSSPQWSFLPAQIKEEVSLDLAQELSQRLIDAESEGQALETEDMFKMVIAEAIKGFDASVGLVREHVRGLGERDGFNLHPDDGGGDGDGDGDDVGGGGE